MSDSLASERTLERPSDDGQVERASEAQPQRDTDGQTSDNGKAAQEQDNIRKLQSTYDKKFAERERAFQAQQQQANAQIMAMRRQLEQLEDSTAPDDFTRLEKQLKRVVEERDQYANAYQQSLIAQQEAQARTEAFQKIATRYGVSVKDIEAAEPGGYEDAVDAAIEARDRLKRAKQANDADRRERNSPDLGEGAPRTAMTSWDRDYQAAMQSGDTPAVMRLLRTRPK